MTICSLLFVFAALTPAFVFSNYNGLPTTGEYTVQETSAILVNEGFPDPFETDGSNREVPVHFYYPENAEGEFPLIVFSHGAFGYYQSNVSTYMELASNGYVVAALDHPHHSMFTKDTSGKTIIVDNAFISDVMKVSSETNDIPEEEINTTVNEWLSLRVVDETGFLNK